MSNPPRFILDVMLGTLAKWLRIFGYDALYDPRIEDRDLLDRASQEGRLVLTRDARLIRELKPPRCLLVHGESLPDQIQEVLDRLGLRPEPSRILSRCLICNSPLEPADPEAVRRRVPPRVYATQSRFRTCPVCRRIYWPGTHRRNIYRRLSGRL